MKANEKTWMELVDPEYSVLRLRQGVAGDGVRYLDVETGWRGSRRLWPAPLRRPERECVK
jgi:hypothetical protein